MFWFHSWYNPIRSIIIKKNLVLNQIIKLVILNVEIIGKINTISTSKIRKIVEIKKKCNENGIRAKHLGSNPHSNGEHFSRSSNDFFDRINEIIISRLEIRIINKDNIIKIIIIYINYYY